MVEVLLSTEAFEELKDGLIKAGFKYTMPEDNEVWLETGHSDPPRICFKVGKGYVSDGNRIHTERLKKCPCGKPGGSHISSCPQSGAMTFRT